MGEKMRAGLSRCYQKLTKILTFLVFHVLFVFSPIELLAQNTLAEIRWLFGVVPPTSFPLDSGRLGWGQLLNQSLHEKMPGVSMRFEESPFARSIRLAEAGLPICMVTVIRTPDRERHLQFTDGYVYAPPTRLFATREVSSRLSQFSEGGVDFEQILSMRLRTGVVRGRAYGASIDAFVSQHQSSITGATGSRQLVEMFLHHRVDVIFMTPPEVVFYQEEFGVKETSIRSFSLPGSDEPIRAPVAGCTRGPWGAAATAAIDEAWKQPGVEANHYQNYFKWLDPESRTFMRRFLEARGIQVPPDT